jgi:gamma-glutamyltranspeptidase/glutathione hydrolase
MVDGSTRVPRGFARIGDRRRARQCAILAGLTLLTGCVRLATPAPNVGFTAADEPHAVAVARDILAHGGNAADAAAAMGLTLAVTLPSRASLGGGGACIVRTGRDLSQKPPPGDFVRAVPQVAEFLPQAAHDGAAVGLPSVVRGLFALQVKYGKLRWAQIVAPAENMARFGAPVSRALVSDVVAAKADITGPTGKPLAEGDLLPQGDLANVFAELRTQGAASFATGRVAAAIVDGSGGGIDAEALRSSAVTWRPAAAVPFGNDVVYFAGGPGSAGAEQIWREVRKSVDRSLYATLMRVVDIAPDAGSPVDRAVAVADAGAMLAPRAAPPAGPGDGDAATSFVAVDGRGDGVACSLTMGRLFGAGRILGGTGILASLPVPGTTSDGASGAAMLIVNEHTDKLLGAIAAGGDRSGPQAMVQVALGIAAARQSVPDALAVARLYAPTQGALYAEPGLSLGARKATEVPAFGIVNAVMCPSGLPVEHPDCVAQTDPRGSGFTDSFGNGGPAPPPPAQKPNRNAT